MFRSIIIAAVVLSFGAPAYADCAEEMAAMAPDGIAKDGTHMPMEGAGGAPQNRAMSQQDVEAQQKGNATAAEQAHQASPETLARAKAALDAGNEEECLRILKEM